MIGRLEGRVIDDIDATSIVVDVNGVGYEVTLPLGTLGRTTTSAAGTVVLSIHTNVREDALELYGFASTAERTVFRTLLGIPNVGPKLALSILGSVAIDELALAVVRGDAAKLTAIPGVGKKTAQRLVLELKDKLDGVQAPARPGGAAAGSTGPRPSGAQVELLGSALARMGFRAGEIDRALGAMAGQADLEKAPLADLVRLALAQLAR
jgi:Holliday junction DNA helicase RuvA